MATLRFDQYQREAQVAPLSIQLPDGDTVTIAVPNGQQMMDAEEAGTTRKALKVVTGDAWPKLSPLLNGLNDPAALQEFVRDVMSHFRMTEDSAPPAAGPR